MKSMLLLLLVGCSGPPEAAAVPSFPEVLSCKTDGDCVIVDFGSGAHHLRMVGLSTEQACCGSICGTPDVVTTSEHASAHAAWREGNCADVQCPVAKCAETKPWEPAYSATCTEGTCQRVEAYTALPDKAALNHLCVQMTAGPSEAVQALPPVQQQAAWMAEMTQSAAAADVGTWDTFSRHVADIPPAKKQAWLDAGIKAHGLETACVVMAGDPK